MFVASSGNSSSTAGILHADLDAFYASVEQRDDPRLRDRPVIVGGGPGDGSQRSWRGGYGIVLAASYQAKARGVRTAMGARMARALCPEAVVVPPRFAAYTDASRAVFDVFHDTTPLVEGISIDEAFLDVHGLHLLVGPPVEIAARLRAEVAERVGLTITVGVARTKFLAKVASRVAKPDGLLEVPPERELAFLHPLRVELLWGVGPATAAKLHEIGVTRVGEVAELGEAALVSMLGPATGRHLHALAHNHDPRPVRVGRRRSSIGAQRALGSARAGHARSRAEVDAALDGLVDRVTRRMRGAGRVGRTVVLRLRFGDFSRVTRSHTLAEASAGTEVIRGCARGLLAEAWPMVLMRGLTMIGVAVSNLCDDAGVQLVLPFEGGRQVALDAALDVVRARFGSAAVTRGALVGRGQGLEMPTLPD
jgi:DNA polymerase-4